MWKIHVHKEGQHLQHTALNWRGALAVACILLREGIEIERIEGPEGFEVSARVLRPLCEIGVEAADSDGLLHRPMP